MKQKILEVKSLTVSFNELSILKDISFSINKGEVLAVIGPNGAGKSVLLKSLLGFIPYKGEIEWASRIKISYVPQKLEIDKFLPLTVKEFLEFKTGNKQKIKQALEMVGIKFTPETKRHLDRNLLNRKIGLISGGEFQRILVAWALIDKPDVLLFDEPTSGIDIGGEQTIYKLLAKLQKEEKITIILVSHDLNIVYKYANNVLCLNRTVVCFGEPISALSPKELNDLYGAESSKFYHHKH